MANSSRILEFLLQRVDTFSQRSIPVRIIVFMLLVTFTIHMITLCTTSWIKIEANGQDNKEGLWQRCADAGDYTCCQTVDSFLRDANLGVPGQLIATRAFVILSLLTGVAAILLMMFKSLSKLTDGKPHLLIASCSLEFIASAFALLGLAIYGGGYRSNAWLKESTLGASFYFVIFVMLFYIILGALSVYELLRKKHQVQSSPTEVQQSSPEQNPSGTEKV